MRFDRKRFLKALDSILGPALCNLLGTTLFLARKDSSPVELDSESIRRMLVIRPGGIGDMLVLLPVLQQIRALLPNVGIDLVCETRNVDVLQLAGLADHAMPYDTQPFHFLRQLRKRHYDIVFDTEQFHHFSAIFAVLSGAPVRIGYKINPRRNPLYTHLADYSVSGPEGRQFALLFQSLGLDPATCSLEGCLAQVPLTASATENTSRNKVIDGSTPFAAIHPGASTRYKQWSPARFAELAATLHEQHGLATVLIGGKDDGPSCRLIAAGTRQQEESLSVSLQTTLSGAAGILKQAALFIGTDSGLAHLAIALGRPTVVLFGPSDHRKWGVEDATHAIVHKETACAPCFIFGYHRPCRQFTCMQGIEVQDVLDACRRILSI
jgi:ADP-heptose:LPS heptosyltransferase